MKQQHAKVHLDDGRVLESSITQGGDGWIIDLRGPGVFENWSVPGTFEDAEREMIAVVTEIMREPKQP